MEKYYRFPSESMRNRFKEGQRIPMGDCDTHSDGLYMLGSRSGTIRRCGPVGIGVALLEEMHHLAGLGGGLRASFF